MSVPYRVQRKRAKDWKMPPNTIYVGRPTKWGNPFIVGRDGTAKECVKKFSFYLLENNIGVSFIQEELKGKNLACWCPLDQPCHADILLKLANE